MPFFPSLHLVPFFPVPFFPCALFSCAIFSCAFSGVEFRWSWGTAILALEKFELMRAPQQFQWLVRGTKANLKILKGHHGKLCSYSHLTSYIFLKLKDEREGAGLACPSFGNCIELFSLVKTLLTIDKTNQGKRWKGYSIILPSLEAKFKGHHGKGWRSHGICRGCRREIRPLAFFSGAIFSGYPYLYPIRTHPR